jgi:hypothetical protein
MTSGTTCLQECLAVYLDMPAYAVPDFGQYAEEWYPQMEAWLNAQGWQIDRYRAEFGDQITGMCIAKGMSPRGTHHVVILLDGELLYDPHPSEDGLICDEWYYGVRRMEVTE